MSMPLADEPAIEPTHLTYLWAAASNIGLRRRRNEDSFSPLGSGRTEDELVAAVADGMGGHVGGDIASRLAIEAAVAKEGGAGARVDAGNQAIVAHVLDHPDLLGMGTTLTLGIFSPSGSLEMGHVGDSRAYLARNGILTQITTDHSVVAELLASGAIAPDEVANHPQRNLVTRSLGLARSVHIDIEVLQLQPGDRVIICSDGLTGMVPDDGIAAILAEAGTPEEAVWHLIERANGEGGHDNVTVVVVDAGS